MVSWQLGQIHFKFEMNILQLCQWEKKYKLQYTSLLDMTISQNQKKNWALSDIRV